MDQIDRDPARRRRLDAHGCVDPESKRLPDRAEIQLSPGNVNAGSLLSGKRTFIFSASCALLSISGETALGRSPQIQAETAGPPLPCKSSSKRVISLPVDRTGMKVSTMMERCTGSMPKQTNSAGSAAVTRSTSFCGSQVLPLQSSQHFYNHGNRSAEFPEIICTPVQASQTLGKYGQCPVRVFRIE